MNKILRSILYIALIALILFVGFGAFKLLKWMEPDADLILPPSSFEWSPLKPIELPPELATNLIASNVAWEANQYLTNTPYIIKSNDRIYAGLHDREWSISYKITSPYNHEAGIIVGADYGVYYRFNPIGKLTVGGQLVWDGEKEIGVNGTVGMRF